MRNFREMGPRRRLRPAGGDGPAGIAEAGSTTEAMAAIADAEAPFASRGDDSGTWLGFENRGELQILFEGDDVLFNPYGVILVNPERHAHVKAEEGQAFIDWLISDAGQQAIGSYTLGGEQLFFPNAE